jgi:NAD-dependent DNA ligase
MFQCRVRAARGHDQPIDEQIPDVLLAVRHIGPRRARRLIRAFGADWEALVDQAPERVFGTLRGIGPRQARAAAASWRGRPRSKRHGDGSWR